jgi:hypothetical protein
VDPGGRAEGAPDRPLEPLLEGRTRPCLFDRLGFGLGQVARDEGGEVKPLEHDPFGHAWPTLYIRGSEGLLKNVNRVFEASGGQLEYVGEWHSHPDGCPTLPSGDDLKVFSWLTEHMSDAGLPALMAIVGDRRGSSWYLGEMLTTGGWGVIA